MGRPGIGYVPDLLGKIALVLSAAILVASWLEARRARGKEQPECFDGGAGPWVIAALLVAYPLALDTLGFFLATIPLFYFSLIIMGHRNKLTGLAIAAAAVIVTYYLFSAGAGVRFPAGVFG
jgi:hypothetical protein